MKRLRTFITLMAGLALALVMAPPVNAQGAPQSLSPQVIAQLRQLQQAALKSDYAYRQAAHLCNNIGPRISGSRQAQQAVQYVADELQRLGLDVRLERVMVPHWVRGAETAQLVTFPGQAPGTAQKIVLTALGGSTPTPPQGLTADLVVVNSFEQLDALPDKDVEGRVVLFNESFDKRLAALGYGFEAYSLAVVYRTRGAVEAARKGGVAALVRSVGSADYRLPHTGAMHYENGVPEIPAAAVTAEDADLMAALASQGRVRLHLTLTPRTLAPVPSYNVVADLKGSERPDEIVIMSGHLDSWDLGTGAIDDAAGVAMGMETARLLKELHLRPARTIRIVAWMNEENGLAGARAYALAHKDELNKHFAAVESDEGAGHPAGFSLHAGPSAADLLEPVAAVLESSGAAVIQPSPNSGGADVSPLDRAGVPTFGILQDSRTYFHYHHTAADTMDKIDPHELAENVAVASVLTYALANVQGDLRK